MHKAMTAHNAWDSMLKAVDWVNEEDFMVSMKTFGKENGLSDEDVRQGSKVVWQHLVKSQQDLSEVDTTDQSSATDGKVAINTVSKIDFERALTRTASLVQETASQVIAGTT